MFFNISIIKAKLRGRKTLVLGNNSKLMATAKIYNLRNRHSYIRVGDNSIIKGELLTFAHGGEISVGSKTYIGEGSRIWSGKKIEIGDFVMISYGVTIIDNLTHPLDYLARRKQFECLLSFGHPHDIELNDMQVTINDDAWIGANAIILKGVSIGKRAIVGAGSVVVKDVPDDHIVVGNPAKFIGFNGEKTDE